MEQGAPGHPTVPQVLWKRLPLETLAEVCRRWRVRRLWAFGSVLGAEFRPTSDIDLLVEFLPEAEWGLLELADMQEELANLVGRQVDLIEKSTLENPYRRRAILETCVPLYEG